MRPPARPPSRVARVVRRAALAAATWLVVRPLAAALSLALRLVSLAIRALHPRTRRRVVRVARLGGAVALLVALVLLLARVVLAPSRSSLSARINKAQPAVHDAADAKIDLALLASGGKYRVAEETPWTRVLELALQRRGYKRIGANDGAAAWVVGCARDDDDDDARLLGCAAALSSAFARQGVFSSRLAMADAMAQADLKLGHCAVSRAFPHTVAVRASQDLSALDFGADEAARWVVKRADALAPGPRGLPLVTDRPLQGLRRLRRTADLVVQRLVARPLRLRDGAFTVQVVVAVARAKPLLAFYAATSAVLRPNQGAELATAPRACLPDVLDEIAAMRGRGFVHQRFVPRVEQLLRLALAVAGPRRPSAHVLAVCAALQVDEDWNVWLLDAATLAACVPYAPCGLEAAFEQAVRASDFIRSHRRAPRAPSTRDVATLVDEAADATWATNRLCADDAAFARWMDADRARRDAVAATVSLDGQPRTRYAPRPGAHVRCAACGYAGNVDGQASCDACGAALEASARPFRAQLLSVLEKHDPSRAGAVDAMLAKYAGREADFIERTRRQYEALQAMGEERQEAAASARSDVVGWS